MQECTGNNSSIIRNKQIKAKEDSFQYGRLFADFSLKLLLIGANKEILDQCEDVLLNSIVGMVVECLQATHN